MKITISRIIKDVESHFGLTQGELSDRSRSKTVCIARKLAFYLARKYTEASYPEIANMFHRDHTTAVAAVQTFDERKHVKDLEVFKRLYTKGGFNDTCWEGVF